MAPFAASGRKARSGARVTITAAMQSSETSAKNCVIRQNPIWRTYSADFADSGYGWEKLNPPSPTNLPAQSQGCANKPDQRSRLISGWSVYTVNPKQIKRPFLSYFSYAVPAFLFAPGRDATNREPGYFAPQWRVPEATHHRHRKAMLTARCKLPRGHCPWCY
jgi:hypothetical protein